MVDPAKLDQLLGNLRGYLEILPIEPGVRAEPGHSGTKGCQPMTEKSTYSSGFP